MPGQLTLGRSPSWAVKATLMVYLMARPVMVPWASGMICWMASTMLPTLAWLFRENSLRTCRQGEDASFYGNHRGNQGRCGLHTWLEY